MATEKSVLVCEDDIDVRMMLAFVLEYRLGFKVTSCINGSEAKGLLDKSHFDLVVSDFEMKDENGTGKDVFNYMLDKGINIPFIMLTSYYRDDFVELRHYENFKYVHKLDFEDFLTEIATLKFA